MVVAEVVVGACSMTGAAASGPPEQAETNTVRTNNRVIPPFMFGVFHESGVLLGESPVEHPCVSAALENHGRRTVTICGIRRWSPSLNRETGLSSSACLSWFGWWSWGESKHRNLSGESVWTASARGFNDVCLSGKPVSVWWCPFCAMKWATRKPDASVVAVSEGDLNAP